MGTRIKPVIPLEIGKRNRKTWKTSPSQCVAILGESDEIKEKAFQLVKEIIEEKGFIAIWFYDPFDHSLYLEPFKACRSVELREDFALFEINKNTITEEMVSLWGEYDILDIYIPKKEKDEELIKFIVDCSKPSKYDKSKLSVWELCSAVISDSGDGNELQIIYDPGVWQKIQAILGRLAYYKLPDNFKYMPEAIAVNYCLNLDEWDQVKITDNENIYNRLFPETLIDRPDDLIGIIWQLKGCDDNLYFNGDIISSERQLKQLLDEAFEKSDDYCISFQKGKVDYMILYVGQTDGCLLSIRKDFAQSAQPRVQAFASEESWREHELGE